MKKVVAITGGTKGIGKAIAMYFVEKGYSVAICARTKPEVELKGVALQKQVDVRNQADVNKFVADVVDHFGQLDVFVNCAGLSQWKPLDEVDASFFKDIYETNVGGTLWGSQAAAGVMKSGGSIVNVSSLAGKRGSANNSVYCASKFAVNGLTQALAKELGPRNIRVNAVCPVYVETEMILDSLKDKSAPAQGQNVQAYLNNFAQTQTALKRLPKDSEVAQAVGYLAGDESSAITGQCINVDCGTLPQ